MKTIKEILHENPVFILMLIGFSFILTLQIREPILRFTGIAQAAEKSVEDANKSFFDAKVAMCKKSKCPECGRFYYVLDGVLAYHESFCETQFKMEEEVRKEYESDAAIREKYGKGAK